MRTLINFLLFLAIFSASILALAEDVSTGFNKRGEYLNKTQLGNPSTASKVIDTSGDVSHLGNLNDSGLTDRGKELLRTSENGKLLQNAEEKKIDALQRYKIDPNNGWLKNSLELEENPMSKTGGRGLSATEKTTAVQLKKSCVEGVDFNVDVGVELILEAEEEEYLGPQQTKASTIKFSGAELHHQKESWGFARKRCKKHWDWFITPYHPRVRGSGNTATLQVNSHWRSDPQAIINDARIYIAAKLNVPLEQIREDIVFPGQGIGGQFWGVGRWRHVWNEYEFGYHYLWQDKLKRMLEKGEYWQVVTEGTEQLAESNECYETARVCLKSGVKTFFSKYDISRPCWYEKVSYRCTSEPKNGCNHLMKQNCQLQDSVCEHQVGNICLRWKRNYICGGVKKELIYSSANSPIHCLGGDCHTPVLEENKDFANVAYLAALNEAKKDCTPEGNSGTCKNPITVFPGQKDGCRKIITGFVNCCSSMKGWGNNTKLCKCSGNERGLALKREKGLCHEVGTYCSHKDPIFGKCLTKTTNFCCFSSKLARIFQEQGRKQLGIGWGSASSPSCQPLTLDQLTKLDFSKFDMDELFDALLSKGKSNMNKTFPVLKPGEVPAIQQEHMKTK